MEYTDTSKIPQNESGIYYGNNERLESINSSLYERNKPDLSLRPNFDFRSIPTRYSQQPVLDQRQSTVPIRQYNEYSLETEFAGVQSKAPISGFKVERESLLRNQFFALQHGADQGIYVPSSTSDLYNVQVPYWSHPEQQNFPDLFIRNTYTTSTNNYIDNSNIGKDRFNNNTRTQMRNT
jgi:hypothetical protein